MGLFFSIFFLLTSRSKIDSQACHFTPADKLASKRAAREVYLDNTSPELAKIVIDFFMENSFSRGIPERHFRGARLCLLAKPSGSSMSPKLF